MLVKIYPTDLMGERDISKETIEGIKLFNPHDMIEKNLNFSIHISRIQLNDSYRYEGVGIEYSLLDNSYKRSIYKTPLSPIGSIDYQACHVLSDLSETTISQYIDQPIDIKVWGEMKEPDDDELTTRNDDSGEANRTSLESERSEKSTKPVTRSPTQGIIVSNFDVMSKIDLAYNKQKEERKSTTSTKKSMIESSKKKNKDDCSLF